MVTLLLDSTQLEVVLSAAERALSFRRQNVRIERSSIAKVQLTGDPWTWLRGVPSPGTRVPGVLAMGTWKSAGGEDFVVIRRRRPGVVIDLTPGGEGDADEAPYQRVVLTTRHGLALVQALQLDGTAEAADVVQLATGAISLPPADETADAAPKAGAERSSTSRPAPAT